MAACRTSYGVRCRTAIPRSPGGFDTVRPRHGSCCCPLRSVGLALPLSSVEHFSCRCSAGLVHLWAFSAMETPLHAPLGIPSNRRNALTLSNPIKPAKREWHPGSKALKARSISAWGNAPGIGPSKDKGLKARSIIPHSMNALHFISNGSKSLCSSEARLGEAAPR
jgi:hypothetical protein